MVHRRVQSLEASARSPAGWALLLTTAFLVVHGARAGVSQAHYYRAKFGRDRDDIQATLALSEQARKLYRHNYYFSLWTAERAWHTARGISGAAAEDWFRVARRWCEEGLRQNPLLGGLRLLKARLLAREQPAAAAREWAEYVDWHFWEPWNHAVLVELRAAAGDWEGAVAALRWVRGTRYEQDARRALSEAWSREQQGPP